MLQSCVFRSNVDTRQWLHAAARRAIKTMAQTFIATIGTVAYMGDVDWPLVASASALSGILSIATSIAGLPEVNATYNQDNTSVNSTNNAPINKTK